MLGCDVIKPYDYAIYKSLVMCYTMYEMEVIMNKIVLIGDSTMIGSNVSTGYGPFLANMLEGRAKVFLPLENCQDTRFTYACLDELFHPGILAIADVIHWNNGLWDVLHFLGSPKNVVPLPMYIELISKIYSYLRTVNPCAKIIFATTIPVVEFDNDGGNYRKNSEIADYNRAAVELLAEKGVIINDLYALCSGFDKSNMAPDGVHLNDDSSRILATHTAALIESVLGEWS